MEGLCTYCQAWVPVEQEPCPSATRQLLVGMSDDLNPILVENRTVMAPHDAFGKFCQGTGTAPQATREVIESTLT